MKTAKNVTLLSLMAVMAVAPGFAANTAAAKTAAAAPAACTTACTQGAATGDATDDSTAAGTGKQDSSPAVSVGVGKGGVSLKLNGGLTFGKSVLGKVLGGN